MTATLKNKRIFIDGGLEVLVNSNKDGKPNGTEVVSYSQCKTTLPFRELAKTIRKY
jgi:hypothetical protein